MARPMHVFDVPAHSVVHNGSGAASAASFLIDFGREFQGGVVLTAANATAGTQLRLISGELLLPGGTADPTTGSRLSPANTWGYELNWTLREGHQVLRQHNYMLFRSVACTADGQTRPPLPSRAFRLSCYVFIAARCLSRLAP